MIAVVSAVSWLMGLAVFCLMALLLLILPGAASPRSYDAVLKAMSRLLVHCFPIRVRVEGLSRLDPRRRYLFIANHVNLLDGFLLYGRLPWFLRGLELETHFSWPIYGWFIRTLGNIPIPAGGGPSTAAGLRRAEKALASGTSILVLPEGRRTRTGTLGGFGRGAFRIAERTGAEIVPIVMAGAFHVMRKGRWTVSPGTVRLVIGESIRPADHAAMKVAQLRDLAHERMRRMLERAGDRGALPLGSRSVTES